MNSLKRRAPADELCHEAVHPRHRDHPLVAAKSAKCETEGPHTGRVKRLNKSIVAAATEGKAQMKRGSRMKKERMSGIPKLALSHQAPRAVPGTMSLSV